MYIYCTATVVYTNVEIYWTTVVELFCIHSNVNLHLDNYVATLLAGKY